MAESTVYPYVFIVLDRLWPWSRWLLGALIFLVIGGVLSALMGLWTEPAYTPRWKTNLGICLFFSFTNAYALTVMAAVSERMQGALDQLRPELKLTDEAFDAWRQSIAGAPLSLLSRIALIALALGAVHNLLLLPDDDPEFGSGDAAAGWIGTLLTWSVMFHVITALVRNAHQFDLLGRNQVTVDVLRPGQLVAFGTAAWLPAAALMGTQVAYPLLSLGGFNPWASLPGFALTLLSVVYLLVRPMWGVHVHLREAKTALIRSTDAQIRRWRAEHPGQNLPDGAWPQISALLQFRSQATALSEWPFNLGLALRWLVYVVIPPVTWILAAFVENLVDAWTL